MVERGALSEYVDNLQAEGRLTCTREEALRFHGARSGTVVEANGDFLFTVDRRLPPFRRREQPLQAGRMSQR